MGQSDQKQAKDEVEVSDLSSLGPKVDDSQVVAFVDGIQVRRPEKRRFHELRTAKVITPKIDMYLVQMLAFLDICCC